MPATYAFPVAISRERVDAALITVIAATLFNMGLCFLYTMGLPVGSAVVVAGSEIIISAVAFTLSRKVINDRALMVMMIIVAYLLALWLLRQGSGPKIVRDLMIPFVYYYLGVARGTPERVDRLVRILLIIVLAIALLEWLNLELYTKLLNVSDYFLAKGMISESETESSVTGTGVGLYISGMRIDGRNFLPFLEPLLGLHRISSVFLEPIELSNFAAICYAWLLCRFRAHSLPNTLGYMAISFALIAFCDSRFASMVCMVITLFHLVGVSRQTLFVTFLPIVICGLTLLRTFLWRPVVVGDDLMGRLYTSGSLLASFTMSEWFGLRESLGPIGDAGYAYLVTYAGFLGAALLWVCFLAGSGATPLAKSVRGAIAIYLTLLLTVSYGSFSIKTAALLWFIYGAVASVEPEDADV
jgi:putative polymerase